MKTLSSTSALLLTLTLSPGVALFGCKVEIGETIGTESSDDSDTVGSSSTTTVTATGSTTAGSMSATGSTTDPITTGETTGNGLAGCGDPGTNSSIIGDQCFCDGGYDWCSDDPDDYTCCGAASTGSDSDSEGDSEGSTSTGGMICDLQPPPESCDPETELAYCTSTVEECVAQSEYYICSLEGEWVAADGSADCTLLGFDFTYGCIDSGELVEQLCGSGPGTACEGPDTCADDDVLNYCVYEKLGAISCLQQCQDIGDEMGVTYDFGSCGEQEGEFSCICCDLDEPGCGE